MFTDVHLKSWTMVLSCFLHDYKKSMGKNVCVPARDTRMLLKGHGHNLNRKSYHIYIIMIDLELRYMYF